MNILAKVLQKLILAAYYLLALLVLYFVLKVVIFILMFALKEYMGYEIISRIWLKVIAMFLANALLMYNILKEYFQEKENEAFENMRKKIEHNLYQEKDRKNLIIMNSKIKVE